MWAWRVSSTSVTEPSVGVETGDGAGGPVVDGEAAGDVGPSDADLRNAGG